MDSITRTPSSSSPKQSPRELRKKSILEKLEIIAAENPVADVSSLATEAFLGALPEPSPFDPPLMPNKTPTESKPKEIEATKVVLETYFARQKSIDSQDSQEVWNTGYFYDLTAGSGDLWKERSVWASHPSVFETRKKKEAERYAMETRETGHNCGVLFWGW